ncbi:MAG: AAA family ATPase [Clostridia bacterium]|nr:AAA family ATPase [Clostridia bacterium]
MGVYLNPKNDSFEESFHSDIYVDKSELIHFTDTKLRKSGKYICVSRPRRFGKSVNLNMLSAFYSKGCDSRAMFEKLKIAETPDWDKYMNQYNVIHLNMQEFLSNSNSMDELLDLLKRSLLWELTDEFSDVRLFDSTNLSRTMKDIYNQKTEKDKDGNEKSIPFVILIDEWDCVFREHRDDKEAQEKYLDFIRDWLKDKSYVALAYMTGILPIKKYGTHSALNMFDEYSMVDSADIASDTGFTEEEVEELCREYNMDTEKMKYWYNGYQINNNVHLYCPRSVVSAISRKNYSNYWSRTETYEALAKYIAMDMDGLHDAAEQLLAGQNIRIDINTFQNDMTSMNSRDDVLTLLVHLGYLSYVQSTEEVYIPNKEVRNEYVTSMRAEGKWKKTIEAVQESKELLELTINGKASEVAEHIEKIHREGCDPKHYNSEQALRYTVLIAYFYAREKYTIIQEMPAGNGFADILLMPNFQNPDGIPIIIELKYDKSADSAIAQIKNRHYPDAIKEHKKVLLVGINYDKDSTNKKHECVIEEITK